MADGSEVIELTQLRISECFVYQLTRKGVASSGHRAEEWGLDKPLLTGSLKVVQRDNTLLVRVLAEKKEGEGSLVTLRHELFAECPIDLEQPGAQLSHFVETVADSSRYFVLRFVDPRDPAKRAFMGCGFRERQAAFDLRATLQDYERFCERVRRAKEAKGGVNSGSGGGASDEGEPPAVADDPNLALKKGGKLSVNLKGSKAANRRPRPTGATTGAANACAPPALLPPPPPQPSPPTQPSPPSTSLSSPPPCELPPPGQAVSDKKASRRLPQAQATTSGNLAPTAAVGNAVGASSEATEAPQLDRSGAGGTGRPVATRVPENAPPSGESADGGRGGNLVDGELDEWGDFVGT
mmetsp:Transcript_65600/g.148027  ORF Transcript_65600/g.148027 Transcript_65600/m.148027 type:complete len:353 (-) Transcript_65600:114-1172(-)